MTDDSILPTIPNTRQFLHAAFTCIASIATLYAMASFATGFDTDFKVAAIIAITCLGVNQFLDHAECEKRWRIEDSRELRRVRDGVIHRCPSWLGCVECAYEYSDEDGA